MSLKSTYDNEASIPEPLKEHYRANGDGKFELQVEGGLSPTAKVDEFRTNNRALLRQIDEDLKPRLKAYTDIASAEDLAKLWQIRADLDESKLVRSGKLEEAISARVGKLNEEHAKEVKKHTAKIGDLEGRLSTMMIDAEVEREAIKKGARPEALRDIRSRSRERLKMQDGKVVGIKPDGSIDYGKSGQGLTVLEVVEDLVTADDAKHFWIENKGGKSETNRGSTGGIHTGPNPWKRGADFNLTTQMEIAKKDPGLAKRLREEAGVRR